MITKIYVNNSSFGASYGKLKVPFRLFVVSYQHQPAPARALAPARQRRLAYEARGGCGVSFPVWSALRFASLKGKRSKPRKKRIRKERSRKRGKPTKGEEKDSKEEDKDVHEKRERKRRGKLNTIQRKR